MESHLVPRGTEGRTSRFSSTRIHQIQLRLYLLTVWVIQPISKKYSDHFQIKSESTGPSTAPGRRERIRILRPSGGLPPLRVVEVLEKNSQAGTETVVSQLAMAANRAS